MELLAWYNVIFLIPLVFGVILVLGSAFGLTGHDAGHDIAVDGDADTDVGADADADADYSGHAVHAVGDHDADHGHDGHHDRESGMLARILGVLGIGRAPLSVVMMSMALLFGGIGYAMNFILKPILVEGWIYGWVSVAIAAVGMVFFTGIIAQGIAKIMPTTETYRITKRDLIGRTGEAVFDVTTTSGIIQVHDREGNIHQVSCRSRNGSLPKGSAVTLVAYDRESDVYVVVASKVNAQQSTTPGKA